ncbi:Qat anti-phage system associated protein QatB [Desulfomicrobium macestii]|uniref:Qat anti-phage system associated protein QatB n=1 Tax=Desulfomicrobium macestii TaxID=90731 RepID=UPI00178BEB27|nr:Qat anti-phage system associated protein QatB [Desulfomicrobium macestii]
MGTSTAFGGQCGNTPLVPSWLGNEGSPPAAPDGGAAPNGTPPAGPPDGPLAQPASPAIPPAADSTRFSAARNNFSRFAGSGGDDHKALGRAVSHYVSSSSGGARTAAARMGSARGAGSRLLGFLSDAVTRGVSEALRALNLGALAGQPIEDVFLGLADYVCPDGGTIDEGISREAFIETIADLAGAGITDLDGLTHDQMQTVFELYATNAIEARLCNDIGAKTVTLPSDSWQVARVQAQLNDFIRRAVADALTKARAAEAALTHDRVLAFVGSIYEQAFGILQIMGDTEVEGA